MAAWCHVLSDGTRLTAEPWDERDPRVIADAEERPQVFDQQVWRIRGGEVPASGQSAHLQICLAETARMVWQLLKRLPGELSIVRVEHRKVVPVRLVVF